MLEAVESTSVESKIDGFRVFAIRKQTFRQKKKFNDEWKVTLKVYDAIGEEERQWDVEYSIKSRGDYWFFDFSGGDYDFTQEYEKSFCKLTIFGKNGLKLMSRTQKLTGPLHSRFNFSSAYELGYKGGDFKDCVDFSFTLGSCRGKKRKSFEMEKTMLDKGILTDTVIKTKEEQFPCHKFVLAAESEYFRTMFQTDMLEKSNNTVDWTDVFEADVVKGLLHFLYTYHEPPNLKNHHFELMKASHLCQLPKLNIMCAESIGETIRVDNALRVLQTAELYESKELKNTAVRFVVANFPQIIATDGFRQIDPSIALGLLPSVFKVVYEVNPKLV